MLFFSHACILLKIVWLHGCHGREWTEHGQNENIIRKSEVFTFSLDNYAVLATKKWPFYNSK